MDRLEFWALSSAACLVFITFQIIAHPYGLAKQT
jgi:hypothetical protein